MAQLWGGRFTKETDQLVYNFNASISFDQKFYKKAVELGASGEKLQRLEGVMADLKSAGWIR